MLPLTFTVHFALRLIAWVVFMDMCILLTGVSLLFEGRLFWVSKESERDTTHFGVPRFEAAVDL